MTLDQYISGVLQGLGLPDTAATRGFFRGLAAAEGTDARNNPFATSRDIGRGETTFNSHGVKNYLTPEDGIRASVETFKLRYYKDVLRNLRADNLQGAAKALAASPYVGGSQATRDRHAANIVRNSGNDSTPSLDGQPAQGVPMSYANASTQTRAQRIIDLAKQYQGTAYTWGGADPNSGFDCSGFVKWLYERHGFSDIPHYAADQWKLGTAVDKGSLRPGDLVFFNMKTDGPGHVGIYIGNGQFIQASGSQSRQGTGPDRGVKISKLEGWYARNYVGARRLADLGAADILDEPMAPGLQAQAAASETRVLFPFEDPTFSVPFAEPGTADIPSPDRNPAETWKLIGAEPYADADTRSFADMIGA